MLRIIPCFRGFRPDSSLIKRQTYRYISDLRSRYVERIGKIHPYMFTWIYRERERRRERGREKGRCERRLYIDTGRPPSEDVSRIYAIANMDTWRLVKQILFYITRDYRPYIRTMYVHSTRSCTNRRCNNSREPRNAMESRLNATNTENRFSKSFTIQRRKRSFDAAARVDLIENFNFSPPRRRAGERRSRVRHRFVHLRSRPSEISSPLSRSFKFIIRGNALPPDSGWSSKPRTARKSSFCDFMIVTSRGELCIPINL